MQSVVNYHTETTTAMMGGKLITVKHNTPVLTPKEREQRKKEIEKRLFDVFIKYKKA